MLRTSTLLSIFALVPGLSATLFAFVVLVLELSTFLSMPVFAMSVLIPKSALVFAFVLFVLIFRSASLFFIYCVCIYAQIDYFSVFVCYIYTCTWICFFVYIYYICAYAKVVYSSIYVHCVGAYVQVVRSFVFVYYAYIQTQIISPIFLYSLLHKYQYLFLKNKDQVSEAK